MAGMTTSESKVREQPKDITECCLCNGTYKDPRILPCFHTFCLKCLEGAGGSDCKIPGEQMPCPVCRKDFKIPEEGYAALEKNFSMEKLIELTTIASASEGSDRCEDCMEDKSESMSVSEVPFADMYCADCQKKLCRVCSRYHLKNDLTKNHQVAAIADFTCKVQIVAPSNCIKHDRKLNLYCSECKELLCMSCVVESHRNHRLQDVRSTVEDFKNEIKDILSGLEMCMSEVAEKKEVLNCEVEEYCKHLESLKLEVRAQLRATIMLVSEHANLVQQDIEQLKVQKRKEVEAEVEDRDGDLTCFESFKVFCTNVLTKGSDSEICCTVDELKDRFEDLKNIHESNLEIKTVLHRMSFQTSDLEEFVKADNYNIIGTIQACQTEVVGEGEPKIANDNISHDGNMKMEENYGMAICKNGILAKINRLKPELDDARRRIDGLEIEKKAFQKRIDEFREGHGVIRPLKSISNVTMTRALQPSWREVPPSGISIDYKRSPNLVKSLQGVDRSRQEGNITCLTVLDDELFLGCFVASINCSAVEVYDIKTFKFKRRWLVKYSSLSDVSVARIRCISSCTRHKCLFACISTVRGFKFKGYEPVIQRTDVNGSDTREWKIYGGNCVSNLSVAGEGNIIVITGCNSLIEYTRNGVLVHEMRLPSSLGVEYPWHALKLASGNFLVSHGFLKDHLHTVLLLSESGQLIRSFGELPLSAVRSSEAKEVPKVYNPRVLNKPVHMAVDNFGNILVADRDNNRIVVLNSDFEVESCITSTTPFQQPRSVYVDNDRRLLFVCEDLKKISVYHFLV